LLSVLCVKREGEEREGGGRRRRRRGEGDGREK
jgi:hypothetical protein